MNTEQGIEKPESTDRAETPATIRSGVSFDNGLSRRRFGLAALGGGVLSGSAAFGISSQASPTNDELQWAVRNGDGIEVRLTPPKKFLLWVRQQDDRTRTAFAIRLHKIVCCVMHELESALQVGDKLSHEELHDVGWSIANGGATDWVRETHP